MSNRPKPVTNENAITDLLNRARNGDKQAAQDLFEKYANLFRQIIRRKLARRLRNLFDSDDFLQDTRRELLEKQLFEKFNSAEQFIAFLSGVIEKRVLQTNRDFLDCEKRDLQREVPLDHASGRTELADSRFDACVIAMAREDWTTFLKGQPLAYRGILVMLRDGCSYAEVAETLKIDESVIRRIIGRVKEKQLADTSV